MDFQSELVQPGKNKGGGKDLSNHFPHVCGVTKRVDGGQRAGVVPNGDKGYQRPLVDVHEEMERGPPQLLDARLGGAV